MPPSLALEDAETVPPPLALALALLDVEAVKMGAADAAANADCVTLLLNERLPGALGVAKTPLGVSVAH